MQTNFSFRSINLAHISLAFIGVMWVFPFLDFRHAFPDTTFYQEWEAALIGLCAMPLLLTKRYWQQVEIPRIVLLPIGLLLLLPVQYFLDKIASLDQTLLLSMYLLGAVLLIILGHRLREELGLPKLALVLAVLLLLGAELNALVGILQHFMWSTFLDRVVSVKVSAAVIGNIAQPNQFANYITLGLASVGLLYARGLLRIWQAVLLVMPLLFVLVLSGSRGAWLYLLFMAGMSYLWQRRDQSFVPLMKYAVWLVLGFVLMQFIVQIPWLVGTSGKITAFERTFGNAGGISIRIHLWKEAWLIFTHFPLLGAGFGQFAWQHFQLGAELQNVQINGLYNHTHNLVMQLAAETGLAGLSVLCGTLGVWLWQAYIGSRDVNLWWGYIVLAVLGIHSMTEYPLWYVHFIGIAAVLLGMLESKAYRFELRNFQSNLMRMSVSVLLLFGVFSLVQLYQGYKILEGGLALRFLANSDDSARTRLRNSMLEVHGNYALLRPSAEVFLAGMIVPDTNHLTDKLELNSKAIRFLPTDALVYRQIWLLALSDRLPEAKIQLHNALWAHPNVFVAAKNELNQAAQQDPAHFAELLEYAEQKYEEYQQALLAKQSKLE
ncbi:MAG: Wzy polymerase domain-containing protein [Gallionella sp.]|nr:Wzy polymerase domain-containing protein [Gallionella sp.]